MGEIDTKPIESVQAVLPLFGEKRDQKKYRSISSDEGIDKEGLESLHKEIANYKVQLEAKEAAYMQSVLELQQYREKVDELSTVLVKSELEKKDYDEECRDARHRIDVLETKVKECTDQLSEAVELREQLSHALAELKTTQGELLKMETELAGTQDLKLKAITRAEMAETIANIEKERTEELLKLVEDLNGAVLMLKLDAKETEEDKLDAISKKDAEIEVIKTTANQALELLEDMKKQVGNMEDLEDQLVAKSMAIESLELEISEANELLRSSENASSDAMANIEKLEADLEEKERKTSDQATYIELLKMELNHLRKELASASQDVNRLCYDIETLGRDLQIVETELGEARERESQAEVEIAFLKSELHKARSKIAAAETAEARATSVKSGLYLAVQQLAVEAEEAKKENQRLKHGADRESDEAETDITVDPRVQISSLDEESSLNLANRECDNRKEEIEAEITISLEEYESLLRNAEKAKQSSMAIVEVSGQLTGSESKQEMDTLKRELEVAMMKIGEFRNRAEQAVSRAEAAERAKVALGDQLKRWHEKKQRRKAAIAALREESAPRVYDSPTYDKAISTHPSLGKVLNMKF